MLSSINTPINVLTLNADIASHMNFINQAQSATPSIKLNGSVVLFGDYLITFLDDGVITFLDGTKVFTHKQIRKPSKKLNSKGEK